MIAYWIALNSVNGLGPVRIKHLVECYGTPQAVLDEPAEALTRRAGIPALVAAAIRREELLDGAKRQLDAAQSRGVEVLTLDDNRYPRLLREIYAPPPVLFVKGVFDVFAADAIAVVGTRTPTAYGTRAAEAITRQLVAANLVIVSGLALGIDSAAHETCLRAGGRTLAVLGCGIDITYPAANRRLAERIAESGALVSEFPLGTEPVRYNFPRRNRIISGLSAGVLVVEAGRRSGGLITANYALQQGRDVFAVPGSIFSEKSDGTFELIRAGATPVQNGAEIVESIRVLTHSSVPATSVRASFPDDLFGDEERDVLERITDVPVRLDQLFETSGRAIAELLDILLNLELKGAVKQLAGQQFVKA